jgi:hypothetical protein
MLMKKMIALLIASVLFIATPLATHAAAAPVNTQLILINKKTNQLAFYDNHELVGIFSVATGKTKALTPEGTFKVIMKIVNPYYNKGHIPGGSSNNPLGYRWMGLNVPGTSGGTYGIHGNNNPSSIGTYASAGCVRMFNDENIWLYDRVKMNTTVVIYNSSTSFDQVAASKGYKVNKPVETKLNLVLYANDKTTIFTKSGSSYMKPTYSLPAGSAFSVIGKSGNWYHVRMTAGERWVSVSTIDNSPLVKKVEKVKLTKVTFLYDKAFGVKTKHSLAPQTITSFEHVGSWHHIHTTFAGDLWVKL